MDGKRVLEIQMPENDAKAATVKDYLKELLNELWREGEGFSGKRPFGNSGWEYDLYAALLRANVIPVDTDAGNKLIFAAIKSL